MLTDIFTRSGYKNIIFHDAFESNSLRNQDLGMMERRISQIKTEEPAHSTIRQELIQLSAG